MTIADFIQCLLSLDEQYGGTLKRRHDVPLERLSIFAAVAQAGSFTAAAGVLGVTKTLVSQQISKLEAELGGMLFTRTTRRVSLTEAGQQLFQECGAPLALLRAAVSRFGEAVERPSGTLRVTTAPEYAADVLGPILGEFAALHPELRVDLLATPEVLDLIDARVDLAIRLGWLHDSSLRATQLGTFEQVVVASPEYLMRVGRPTRPEQLAEHRWVALTLLRNPRHFRFKGARGSDRAVRMRTGLAGSSPAAVHGLVRGGAGIAILADFIVQRDLREGRLVRLLEEYQLPSGGIYALRPAAPHPPAKVIWFLDFLKTRVAARR